jgi:hypothetical protein
MKKIITSASLAALGALSLQAGTPLDRSYYAPNPALTPEQRTKWWSVSATLRGFYDDNYNTSASKTLVSSTSIDPATGVATTTTSTVKPRDSFGFEISPSFGINIPLPQTFIGLSYQYSLRWYEDRKRPKDDQTHQADLRITHSITETFKVDIKDSFVVSREPQVLDEKSVTSPLLRRSNSDATRNHGSIDFDAELSPLFSTSFGYENTLYDYWEKGAASYSALLDRMEHLAKVDFRWHALPGTIALLGYQYGMIDHDSKDSLLAGFPFIRKGPTDPATRDSRSHYAFVGADQTFSGHFLASVRVGVQYTQYPDAVTIDGPDLVNQYHRQSRNAVNPYADASVTYTYAEGSFAQLGVRHARNQTDLAFLAGTDSTAIQDQESTTIYGAVTHKITPKVSGNLIGQVQNSQFAGGRSADGGKRNNDEVLYLIGVNVAYQFNQFLSAEVGYNYDRLDSDVVYGDGNARSFSRNRVYIGVKASY